MVIVALLASFFQKSLNLSTQEKNTLNFNQRVDDKDKMMKISAKYFRDNMLYIINKKKIEKGFLNYDKANKKKLISLLKNKMESKRKYKFLYHNFHVNFRMGNKVDEIKRRIDNLDFVGSDLTSNISLIDKKAKDLIVLLNKYIKSRVNKKSKRIKSDGSIYNSKNINAKNDEESIKETESEPEPEPKDSE